MKKQLYLVSVAGVKCVVNKVLHQLCNYDFGLNCCLMFSQSFFLKLAFVSELHMYIGIMQQKPYLQIYIFLCNYVLIFCEYLQVL